MTQMNPFTGSILQSPVVQQQQQSMRQQQVEHQQHLRRNAGASSGEDNDVHNVENPEEITAIHDQERDHQQGRQPRNHREPKDQVELSSVPPEPEEVAAAAITPDQATADASLAHRPITATMPAPSQSPANAQDQRLPLDIKA